MIEVHQADVMKWENDGEPFHAMFCDPPYHLTSPSIGWDRMPANRGKPILTDRTPGGFMGKAWDGGDIAFKPKTWKRFMRWLHPGAFCFAFASSRGWHRMACAIEDAGYILHPTIWRYWSYGSGFPKATRIGKNGDHPEWDGHRYGLQALKPAVEPILCFQVPYAVKPVECITATGAGALWVDGGRIESGGTHGSARSTGMGSGPRPGIAYSGGVISPPHPAGRWPANLVLEHHPDCRRIGTRRVSGTAPTYERTVTGKRNIYGKGVGEYPAGYVTNGYADADGLETIPAWDCHEACPTQSLGEQARFFYQVHEQLDDADPLWYCAKSSRSERDSGLDSYLTVKYNVANLDLGGVPCQNVAMVTVALLERVMSESARSLSIAVSGESIMARCPRDGLSTILTATRQIIELRTLPLLTLLLTSESIADASLLTESGGNPAESVESLKRWLLTITGGQVELARGASFAASEMLLTISVSDVWQNWRSNHPTHKPLALCRYLATLLLPPAAYAPRRILIPFFGVGSEAIGAWQAGWEDVVGIEREREYVEIGNARIAHWCVQPGLEGFGE